MAANRPPWRAGAGVAAWTCTHFLPPRAFGRGLGWIRGMWPGPAGPLVVVVSGGSILEGMGGRCQSGMPRACICTVTEFAVSMQSGTNHHNKLSTRKPWMRDWRALKVEEFEVLAHSAKCKKK